MDFDKIECGINEIIGFNLYSARARNRVKQRYAAELLGISVSQLKKYEQGKEAVRLDIATKACIAYGMSFPKLFHNTAYGVLSSEDKASQDALDRIGPHVLRLDALAYSHFLAIINATFGIGIKASGLGCESVKPMKAYSDAAIVREYFDAISTGVRGLRESRGLSQAQVAEGVDISVSAYQGYEDRSKIVRFSLVLAARYTAYTKINPLVLVEKTSVGKVRQLHDARLSDLKHIIEKVSNENLEQLESLVAMLASHLINKRMPSLPSIRTIQ